MHEVLIASAVNFHGLARLPRFFRQVGCRVTAICPPGSNLGDSSYVEERIPGASDPETVLEQLRPLALSGRYAWIILGDDAVLSAAVARRSEKWLDAVLPSRPGDDEAARALISKVAFSRAMGRVGVAMAEGRDADGPEGIRAAAAVLGLPVIVKPHEGYSGVGLFPARTPEELERGCASASGRYLVERFIDGQVGATAALYQDGKPTWWYSHSKHRVWPAFGPSCRKLHFEPDGIAEVLERVGAALGLRGLVGFDWMLARDGKLYVLELNGRPISVVGPSAHVRRAFPEALRDRLTGTFKVHRPPTEPDREVFHVMPASLKLAFQDRDLRLAAALLTGLAGPTDVPWEDRGLLRNHAARMAKYFVRAPVEALHERLPRPLRDGVAPVGRGLLNLWRRVRGY